ncbi:hypothetical protein PEC301879_18940 [Pectobacterium carotovorum subsp. carotovorum]|nr:hypothetical protein PEC301879_18940 [Pectobacterium carotovorum subsp. carotovorum]
MKFENNAESLVWFDIDSSNEHNHERSLSIIQDKGYWYMIKTINIFRP